MRIASVRDLGLYIRSRRHELNLTQTELARAARVSRRWLLDLEAGKASAQVGLVLQTLHALHVALDARPEADDAPVDLDVVLQRIGGRARG